MAKTYEDLKREIAQLEAEAEVLRQQELSEVISKIRLAIEHYDLSAADLGFGQGRLGKAAKRGKVAKGAFVAPVSPFARKVRTQPGRKPGAKAQVDPAQSKLYRNELGQTWAGRGKRPRWLQEALAAGRTLEDFRVS